MGIDERFGLMNYRYEEETPKKLMTAMPRFWAFEVAGREVHHNDRLKIEHRESKDCCCAYCHRYYRPLHCWHRRNGTRNIHPQYAGNNSVAARPHNLVAEHQHNSVAELQDSSAAERLHSSAAEHLDEHLDNPLPVLQIDGEDSLLDDPGCNSASEKVVAGSLRDHIRELPVVIEDAEGEGSHHHDMAVEDEDTLEEDIPKK